MAWVPSAMQLNTCGCLCMKHTLTRPTSQRTVWVPEYPVDAAVQVLQPGRVADAARRLLDLVLIERHHRRQVAGSVQQLLQRRGAEAGRIPVMGWGRDGVGMDSKRAASGPQLRQAAGQGH